MELDEFFPRNSRDFEISRPQGYEIAMTFENASRSGFDPCCKIVLGAIKMILRTRRVQGQLSSEVATVFGNMEDGPNE